MKPNERYAKQPRTYEEVCRGPAEWWPVLAVHERGRVIYAQHPDGSRARLERAERGWWMVRRPERTTP